jgi:hypothetical protein
LAKKKAPEQTVNALWVAGWGNPDLLYLQGTYPDGKIFDDLIFRLQRTATPHYTKPVGTYEKLDQVITNPAPAPARTTPALVSVPLKEGPPDDHSDD